MRLILWVQLLAPGKPHLVAPTTQNLQETPGGDVGARILNDAGAAGSLPGGQAEKSLRPGAPARPGSGRSPARGRQAPPCRVGSAMTRKNSRKRSGSGSGVGAGRMAADTQVRRAVAGPTRCPAGTECGRRWWERWIRGRELSAAGAAGGGGGGAGASRFGPGGRSDPRSPGLRFGFGTAGALLGLLPPRRPPRFSRAPWP